VLVLSTRSSSVARSTSYAGIVNFFYTAFVVTDSHTPRKMSTDSGKWTGELQMCRRHIAAVLLSHPVTKDREQVRPPGHGFGDCPKWSSSRRRAAGAGDISTVTASLRSPLQAIPLINTNRPNLGLSARSMPDGANKRHPASTVARSHRTAPGRGAALSGKRRDGRRPGLRRTRLVPSVERHVQPPFRGAR
jgi:hypothetical protein